MNAHIGHFYVNDLLLCEGSMWAKIKNVHPLWMHLKSSLKHRSMLRLKQTVLSLNLLIACYSMLETTVCEVHCEVFTQTSPMSYITLYTCTLSLKVGSFPASSSTEGLNFTEEIPLNWQTLHEYCSSLFWHLCGVKTFPIALLFCP